MLISNCWWWVRKHFGSAENVDAARNIKEALSVVCAIVDLNTFSIFPFCVFCFFLGGGGEEGKSEIAAVSRLLFLSCVYLRNGGKKGRKKRKKKKSNLTAIRLCLPLSFLERMHFKFGFLSLCFPSLPPFASLSFFRGLTIFDPPQYPWKKTRVGDQISSSSSSSP